MAKGKCRVELGDIFGLTLVGIRFFPDTSKPFGIRVEGTFRVKVKFTCKKHECEKECTQTASVITVKNLVVELEFSDPKLYDDCQKVVWDKCQHLLVRNRESEWLACIRAGATNCPGLEAHHFVDLNSARINLQDVVHSDRAKDLIAEKHCTCPSVYSPPEIVEQPGSNFLIEQAIQDELNMSSNSEAKCVAKAGEITEIGQGVKGDGAVYTDGIETFWNAYGGYRDLKLGMRYTATVEVFCENADCVGACEPDSRKIEVGGHLTWYLTDTDAGTKITNYIMNFLEKCMELPPHGSDEFPIGVEESGPWNTYMCWNRFIKEVFGPKGLCSPPPEMTLAECTDSLRLKPHDLDERIKADAARKALLEFGACRCIGRRGEEEICDDGECEGLKR